MRVTMQRTARKLDQARQNSRKAVNPGAKLAIVDRAMDRLAVSDFQNAHLGVGDHVQDFILIDSHGRPARLAMFLENGPAALHFYHGGWCPYCNSELCEFQRVLPIIESLGASLLAISPELPRNSLGTEQKNNLTFSVLSDVGNIVARRFGIVYKLPEELVAAYEEAQCSTERANDAKDANNCWLRQHS
jgi:peroxiredoxin